MTETYHTPLSAMNGKRLGMLRTIVSAAGQTLREQATHRYSGEYYDPRRGRPDVVREANEYAAAYPEHCHPDWPAPGRVGRPPVGPSYNVRLHPELVARLDERAKAEGVTRSELIRRGAEKLLDE